MLFLSIFLLLGGVTILYLQQPKFGRLPKGERLKKVQASANFQNGAFQNRSHTPNFTDGGNVVSILRQMLFEKSPQAKPPGPMPSRKTDLPNLPPDENVLVWFGHSSYFMQIDGKRFLIDPVMSGAASPLRFTMPAFPGSDIYTVAELPPIDYLFLSHDHWDHLDHTTIVELKSKVGKIICSLGTGAHLERWGYDMSRVVELDWNETHLLEPGFTVHTAPGRHFSGRSLWRNRVLWMAFILQTPSLRLFLGGDSGYDAHFADIGEQFGPFDLALLECGQYNRYWKHIHLMPEETVQAAVDLKTRRLMPVHWGKFDLSMHAWDESIKRVSKAAETAQMPLVHPMIGEKVMLNNPDQTFERWWLEVS